MKIKLLCNLALGCAPFATFTGKSALRKLLAVAATLVACGCASLSKPMSAGFASVVITGATEAQVREETGKVFAAEEWRTMTGSGAEMVFEREGSKWDHIAYGSNISDDPILNRARVSIVPLADGSMRLQCQAFVVNSMGGPGRADEIRLHGPRAGPYQLLLDKVAAHIIGTAKR